jgi:uncharacterized protein (TIGR02301 family)
LALFAFRAQGQEAPPDPARRQTVADLAYLLGEAHALHRACAGPEDDTWRGQMARLLEVEAPDAGYRRRLTERFNAGFVSGSAAFPACGPAAQEAERRAARKGAALARRLSGP